MMSLSILSIPELSSPSSSSDPAQKRAPAVQLDLEDKLFRVLGLVGGLGFWEAWRLPLVCRELRFGFSGGGAPADMIQLGLERRGVWAELRTARAAMRDADGWTRLHFACLDHEEDVLLVAELVELGWAGCVDARDASGVNAPLALASRCGHERVVRALIGAGADVNAADADGTTALMAACHHRRVACAEVLVTAGADVNARSKDGRTPLSASCRIPRRRAVPAIRALLLAAGATDEGHEKRSGIGPDNCRK